MALSESELALFTQLPGELHTLLEAKEHASEDPVIARLFPRAYLDPTEEEAEHEWQGMVHPDLLRDRLAALETVTASLEGATRKRDHFEVVLTDDDVSTWLGVLNDLRLALGSRLAITEDLDYDDVDPDDPATPALQIYAWLTWLQGELIETLLA